MVGGKYTDLEWGYIDGVLSNAYSKYYFNNEIYGDSPIIQEYLEGIESRNAGCGIGSYLTGTKCRNGI